jgi:hypothetical protein
MNILNYRKAENLKQVRNFKLIIVVQELGQLSGIALDYGLDDRGVRVPAGAGNFSLHHSIQTSSAAPPASYPMVTVGIFPVG